MKKQTDRQELAFLTKVHTQFGRHLNDARNALADYSPGDYEAALCEVQTLLMAALAQVEANAGG